MLSDFVRLKYILTVVLMLCASSGCGYSGDVPSYRSAIRSGRKIIAPALAMEKQFPKTEHMLIMYGGTGSAQHEWQTVSYFGGRYELTMTVDVLLSDDGKTIENVIQEPHLTSTCVARSPIRGHACIRDRGIRNLESTNGISLEIRGSI